MRTRFSLLFLLIGFMTVAAAPAPATDYLNQSRTLANVLNAFRAEGGWNLDRAGELWSGPCVYPMRNRKCLASFMRHEAGLK